MGIFESLLTIAGLAGAAYFTVYYILPYMQQQSLIPYYMMQAMGYQQQQQAPAAPAPAPQQQQYQQEPLTQDATVAPEALEDTTTTDEETAAVAEEEEEKSNNGSGKKDEETSPEEELKKSYAEQKKKRAEYDKSTDPSKDTRYKGKTSREAGREAARKLGFPIILRRYGSNTRFFVQDEYDRYWEI